MAFVPSATRNNPCGRAMHALSQYNAHFIIAGAVNNKVFVCISLLIVRFASSHQAPQHLPSFPVSPLLHYYCIIFATAPYTFVNFTSGSL